MANRLLQQEALAGWLADQPFGLAANLTFRPWLPPVPGEPFRRLDVTTARQTVRLLTRRLDRLAFGSAGARRGKRLAVAVVREGGSGLADKHIHYHLAVQVPERFAPREWASMADEAWTSLDWASPSQNVFKPMWSSGWVDYILKDRDKPHYLDAMDFETWHLV